MSLLKEPINVKEIETTIMYKMLYVTLNGLGYYEAKCLVEVFLEERTDKEELEILKEIRELLFEHKIEEVNEILNNNMEEEQEEFNIFKVFKRLKKYIRRS